VTSAERHAQLKRLFLEACEREAEQRARFLEEECGGDDVLRREVETLLSHRDEDPGGEEPAGAGLQEADRFAAGTLFAARYRIVCRLGGGGMGEVYRADDLKLGVPVALKFLRAGDARHLEWMLNEVRLTREVSHPAVCRVFDVGEAEGQTFFTMEYIEGEDLASQLRRIGRLPASKVLELASELCAGLAAAHARGVLHRDLKPANIMVDAGGHARILDFGIAIREGTPDRTPVGTPAYMAPERLVPGGEATEQGDLYALGLVLYELLAGRQVFAATTLPERRELRRSEPERPSTWAAETGPRLERAILDALREDPRERPTSARAMAEMLSEGTSEVERAAERPTAGERRQLTVMFCELDISDCGPGDLDPEELGEIVRTCQQRVARVVERYDGRVAQYLGHGVLSYFGSPQAHEDDAIRALSAARELVDALSQPAAAPGERAPLRQRAAVQVTLGVDTGRVVFGEAEEGAERPPLAVGEAVNEAIHLVHGAEPGEVWISERTRRLVEGAFMLEERKGQSLPSAMGAGPTYRVVRATGATRPLTGATPFGPTPLIGREPELALLQDRWEQAREGRGQVVLLSGDAGIGKSRLIRALRDGLSEQPHTWLECCGSAFHTHSPFHPLIELAGQVLHLGDEQSDGEKLERLERGLASVGLEPAETLPLFASLLSLRLPERYAPLEISPQLRRQKTLETLRAWVLALAERQPLVLVVEDLHWVDPTTLEWLGMLVEQVPTAALLVVLATRPEADVVWARHSHHLQLTLSPLAPDQVAAIVEAITGGRRVPPELLDEIVKKTDGVPLFVEELTKSVLESGRLKEVQNDLRPELGIPTSLQGSLMARLDRLGPAKPVAQLAAVLGREFSYPLLEAVAPMDAARLDAALARLVDAELLYARGAAPHAAYTFKHALIRDTAYQSLLKTRRQEHHGRIARALEERFTDGVVSRPEVIAHHYAEAGLAAAAIPYFQRAGQSAVQRFAHTEAISHLHKALELLDTLPESLDRNEQELRLQVALGPSLIAAKGYGDRKVERVYERARELCQKVGESPELIRVVIGLSMYFHNRGELQTATDLAKQALALAEQGGEAYPLLAAHTRLGISLNMMGELSPAYEHLGRAIDLYDPPQHRALTSVWGHDWGIFARGFAAINLLARGYPERAQRLTQETLNLAREGDPFSLAFAVAWAAQHHHSLGERDRARERWATVYRGATTGGSEGLAEIQRGLALTEAAKAIVYLPGWSLNLAKAYRDLGQSEAALATLKDAARDLPRVYHWQLWQLRGETLLQQGAPEEAERCFNRALEIARDQHARFYELQAATSLARLLRDQGRRDEARALLQPVYDGFTEGFDTADLKDAKALLEEL
jgi:TOMM system kinase/cyclase fusion protein